jgi:hypothetical protein
MLRLTSMECCKIASQTVVCVVCTVDGMVRLQCLSPTQHCKSAVTSGEVVASCVDSHSARLILVGRLLGVRREEAELNTPDGEDNSISPPATTIATTTTTPQSQAEARSKKRS